MNITISKKTTELKTELQTFWLRENTLVLDTYIISEKETKKHKFKIVKQYDRLNERSFNLKENEVPFTSEIKLEALTKLIDSLKIVTWSEFKNLK